MSDDVRHMYSDGKWVLAEGGATFDVVNPADQSVVASVANGATPEILRAVEAAQAAFREWSLLAPKERGRFLLAIQELMEERKDELARLITLENGKPFEEARKEVQFSLGYFGWFAEEGRRMTGEWIPSPQPGKRYWVFHQPVGPVAAVTPWNFPAPLAPRLPQARVGHAPTGARHRPERAGRWAPPGCVQRAHHQPLPPGRQRAPDP